MTDYGFKHQFTVRARVSTTDQPVLRIQEPILRIPPEQGCAYLKIGYLHPGKRMNTYGNDRKIGFGAGLQRTAGRGDAASAGKRRRFFELESVRHCLKTSGSTAFLKHLDCGPLLYGRNRYDYREGTLVFIAPGQVFGIDDGKILYGYKGWCLMFHPDLLRGTSLARRMADYSFFSIRRTSAAHVRTRAADHQLLREIREELQHAIDKHSKQIIAANIEVLLNHCVRFTTDSSLRAKT